MFNTLIFEPIFNILVLIYSIVPGADFGIALIIFTVIVRFLMYPLLKKQLHQSRAMQKMQPELKKIQAQYKDNKQMQGVAMMELYKTEKINPVGGCLPIMLQIPVFLALYWVLQGSVELRGAEWILWVHDLAMPDPWFVLPALMAATMFLQILLNPKPTDPMQAKVMYIMPVVFSVMFFIFAAGLVLYWLTNNILSIAQQWWINKTIAEERAQRLAKR
jgi:YidC/Oxa1 family membrane protein insertase